MIKVTSAQAVRASDKLMTPAAFGNVTGASTNVTVHAIRIEE